VTAHKVLLEETASAEEVDAVLRLVQELGLDADVRATYARRSAEDLPWLVMPSVPLGRFLIAFGKSYGENLGKHAADGTAAGARHLVDWLARLYAARQGQGQVMLDDPEHDVQILLDRDLHAGGCRSALRGRSIPPATVVTRGSCGGTPSGGGTRPSDRPRLGGSRDGFDWQA
jgi:hypothetical protein